MRKITAAAFVSLDGVMQAPGGPDEDPTGGFAFGGWVAPAFDETMGGFMDAMFRDPFDLLLGRRTYEIFAAHWPFAPADDPIRIAFDRATKYVATRSADLPLDWERSVRLTGDVAAEIARLKQQDGPTLLTQGSSVLLHTLFEHDLIDELRLLTFPVILGAGKRLFTDRAHPGALKLAHSQASVSGVVMSVYARDGAVRTGDFQFDAPSPAEVERRERMKRGEW